jgi:hypothetical protein
MSERHVKYFHILADGKTLREYDQAMYLALLHNRHFQLGWIDDEHVLFTRDSCLVSKEIMMRILKLGGWIQ